MQFPKNEVTLQWHLLNIPQNVGPIELCIIPLSLPDRNSQQSYELHCEHLDFTLSPHSCEPFLVSERTGKKRNSEKSHLVHRAMKYIHRIREVKFWKLAHLPEHVITRPAGSPGNWPKNVVGSPTTQEVVLKSKRKNKYLKTLKKKVSQEAQHPDKFLSNQETSGKTSLHSKLLHGLAK